MLTKSFWKGAAERAIKTFLQVFIAVAAVGVGQEAIGVSAGLFDVDWVGALNVAATATIFSLATSLGNADFTAGVVKPDVYVPPADVS